MLYRKTSSPLKYVDKIRNERNVKYEKKHSRRDNHCEKTGIFLIISNIN